MTELDDWTRRLTQAARALEATPAPPGWLVAAVRDSIAVAEVLAPKPPKQTVPTEFFYPH
jgi:hypothetical protein